VLYTVPLSPSLNQSIKIDQLKNQSIWDFGIIWEINQLKLIDFPRHHNRWQFKLIGLSRHNNLHSWRNSRRIYMLWNIWEFIFGFRGKPTLLIKNSKHFYSLTLSSVIIFFLWIIFYKFEFSVIFLFVNFFNFFILFNFFLEIVGSVVGS